MLMDAPADMTIVTLSYEILLSLATAFCSFRTVAAGAFFFVHFFLGAVLRLYALRLNAMFFKNVRARVFIYFAKFCAARRPLPLRVGVPKLWSHSRGEHGPCDSWPALPENATWEGRRMAAQCDDYFAWLYELDCSWYEQAAADWRVQHNTGP